MMCRETARALVHKGYKVILACRDTQAALDAANDIENSRRRTCMSSRGRAEVAARLDLADNESIRSFATAVLVKYPRIDLLINNAGCNFVPEWRTEDGVQGMVQVRFTAVLYPQARALMAWFQQSVVAGAYAFCVDC
jgi:retinol dehydrogenase 12